MAINDNPEADRRDADYGKNDFSEFKSQWRDAYASPAHLSLFYCTGCNHRVNPVLEIITDEQGRAVYFCENCIELMWQALTTERVKRRLLKGVGFAGKGRAIRS